MTFSKISFCVHLHTLCTQTLRKYTYFKMKLEFCDSFVVHYDIADNKLYVLPQILCFADPYNNETGKDIQILTLNNNPFKCRQNVVFIWKDLYSEVFDTWKESSVLEPLVVNGRLVAIRRAVIGREHCTVPIFCKISTKLYSLTVTVTVFFTTFYLIYFAFRPRFSLSLLPLSRAGKEKQLPSTDMYIPELFPLFGFG